MPRVHLLELEDQPWFPAFLRNAGTAYLRRAAEVLGQARWIVPTLAPLLQASGVTRLVDLCSGGAGPIPSVVRALREEGVAATAVLTDLYPNDPVMEHVANGAEGTIAVETASIDATAVPQSLTGCRTLFNAFHHFRPDEARKILQSAVDDRQPIAVFETVERSAPFLIGIFFSPIAVWLFVPFLRPFDWRWVLFTYLIPIIPLFVIWDGFVSGLRVYSVAELEEMVASIDGEDYCWEVGRVKMGSQPAHVTYLTGHPRSA